MTCAGIERFTVECDNNTLTFQNMTGTPESYADTICDTPQVNYLLPGGSLPNIAFSTDGLKKASVEKGIFGSAYSIEYIIITGSIVC